MNTQLTIQYLTTLHDAITHYLQINTQYRRTRNPEQKATLKQTRATAYRQAQEANATLHTHLLNFKEPDQLRLQARELITRWDHRNTAFENLAQSQNTGQWHENPKEKIIRLDKAETRLRDQLRTITQLLQKITETN